MSQLGKRKDPPTEQDDDDQPLWTVEPEKGWLSDWKIEFMRGNESVIYNVHRYVLVSGKHKSSYFARLFNDNNNFSEATDRLTCITDMDEARLEAFPVLLDYLYGKEINYHPLDDALTAVYHLADYFGVDTVKTAVAIKFLEWVDSLEENVSVDLPGTTSILDSPFWLDVLDAKDGFRRNKNRNLAISTLAVDFCCRVKGSLDYATFQRLTNRKLPVRNATFESILQLLKLEHSIKPSDESDSLTDLQERCMNTILYNWNDSDWAKILCKQRFWRINKLYTVYCYQYSEYRNESSSQDRVEF